MFCCKLYKAISKLLISAIFVFTSLIKVSAEPPKPYKFDNNKMEVCIESNQITIRDREKSNIVYGIPVEFKKLKNGTVKYKFNICIDNEFWIGNCILPYIKLNQSKEFGEFEVKIRNGSLEKKLCAVKINDQSHRIFYPCYTKFNCYYENFRVYSHIDYTLSISFSYGRNSRGRFESKDVKFIDPQGFLAYCMFRTFNLT